MDPKGYEKKPWFPYLKNMYDEVGGDMMAVDAKGYEEKPWWPYVLDLQEKIEEGGGGGGSSDFTTAELTVVGDVNFDFPTILVDEQYNLEGSWTSAGEMTSPYTIILYKGKAYLQISSVESTSGNITLDSETGLYVVTGDCSITLGSPT